jgi:hypothetical protein
VRSSRRISMARRNGESMHRSGESAKPTGERAAAGRGRAGACAAVLARRVV